MQKGEDRGIVKLRNFTSGNCF